DVEWMAGSLEARGNRAGKEAALGVVATGNKVAVRVFLVLALAGRVAERRIGGDREAWNRSPVRLPGVDVDPRRVDDLGPAVAVEVRDHRPARRLARRGGGERGEARRSVVTVGGLLEQRVPRPAGQL